MPSLFNLGTLTIGDRQAQEQAVRFANRDLPYWRRRRRKMLQGLAASATGSSCGRRRGRWRLAATLGHLDTALRFDGAFLAKQNGESTWLRALLRPLREAGLEGDESLRAVKTEVIAALRAALAADVTPELRAAGSTFFWWRLPPG